MRKKYKHKSKKETRCNLISQAEYSRQKNVTRAAINYHVKNGAITLINGLIDPGLADKELMENSDPAREGLRKIPGPKATGAIKGDGDNGLTYKQAKIMLINYQAKLAELTYKEKIREIVKAKDVETAAFNTARNVRDQLLNIPDRIAAIVAAESDKRKVHKILQNEFEKALEGCFEKKTNVNKRHKTLCEHKRSL